MRNLILKEIKKDSNKEIYLNKYFRKYLSENVITQINKNKDNFQATINLVIAQFLNPNDIKIGEFDNSIIIHPIIQNISDTYIRISKYLRSDIKTSCLLINNALIQILNSIIEHEDITCITTLQE